MRLKKNIKAGNNKNLITVFLLTFFLFTLSNAKTVDNLEGKNTDIKILDLSLIHI